MGILGFAKSSYMLIYHLICWVRYRYIDGVGFIRVWTGDPSLKADLHGTIFAYDCHVRFFIAHAAHVMQKSYTPSTISNCLWI